MKATYRIDPAHSSIQFSVRHLMISNVRGTFTGVKGTVVYDGDKPSDTTIEAEIDASTINTLEPNRDAHLKTQDFLHIEKHPTMQFKSTKVEKAGSGLKVTGDLTLHGVTKPVELDIEEIAPEAKDLQGNTRLGAAAHARLKRSDFGLTWNAALETGGFALSDDLKLDFELELVKAQAAAA
jgi:polyisoprenoid-binding protein YceI